MGEVSDPGQWLVEHRADLDRGEAQWLERLAEFDREGLWSLDGHVCCATWLVWRTNMARSTAFEKLRVAHELAAALQAFIDLRYRQRPVHESPTADPAEDGDDSPAVDQSPAEDSVEGGPGQEAPLEEAGRSARKADALMDMLHTALAAADSGQAAGDDRYMVHLVTRDSGRSFGLLDGTPLHPADAGCVACDCATVTHTVGNDGELLNLGRKTREWNTAQRRAVSVRDGGQCRFPGCSYRYYDVHHMVPWDDGGPTDVANGCCQCRRHHRMLHAGYRIEGDPHGELSFYRPDGTYLGSTYPAAARTLAGV